jgi:hypothetical protein
LQHFPQGAPGFFPHIAQLLQFSELPSVSQQFSQGPSVVHAAQLLQSSPA